MTNFTKKGGRLSTCAHICLCGHKAAEWLTKMEEDLEFARKLLMENPGITPEEMFHKLHVSGYGADRAIYAVFSILKQPLEKLCSVAVAEYKQPLVPKGMLQKALVNCGFSNEEVEKAISSAYPTDTARYALVLSGTSNPPKAHANAAYSIGTGDFTIEAWIKPNPGGGTVLSQKATEGGWMNGGFLLVIKPDGVIKLATDDGMGFYEINSSAVNLFDGKYHHVLGLRRKDVLEIYVDFAKVNAQVRTNRYSPLDITNRLGITVGATEQSQEQFRYYSGSVGECRIWNKAISYSSREAWAATDYITPGLIAMWGFWNRGGEDYSSTGNDLPISGYSFESWTF